MRKPVFHALYKPSYTAGMPTALFYVIVVCSLAFIVVTKRFAVGIVVAAVFFLIFATLYGKNGEWVRGLQFLLKLPYCDEEEGKAYLPGESDEKK